MQAVDPWQQLSASAAAEVPLKLSVFTPVFTLSGHPAEACSVDSERTPPRTAGNSGRSLGARCRGGLIHHARLFSLNDPRRQVYNHLQVLFQSPGPLTERKQTGFCFFPCYGDWMGSGVPKQVAT